MSMFQECPFQILPSSNRTEGYLEGEHSIKEQFRGQMSGLGELKVGQQPGSADSCKDHMIFLKRESLEATGNFMSLQPVFKTPDFSHLTQDEYEHIYEPAEDTFLFLDALEKDAEHLRRMRPTICVEVGSGSGVVITFLAQILDFPAVFIAVDRNELATECSVETATRNGISVNAVTCDLLTPLANLKGNVDVLLFNPPYVVTPSSEVMANGISASWAGGKDGREVLDRLLPKIPDLLSASGIFYLVTIKENKPEEIQLLMAKKGFISELVIQRRAGPEHLSVWKFYRKSSDNSPGSSDVSLTMYR